MKCRNWAVLLAIPQPSREFRQAAALCWLLRRLASSIYEASRFGPVRATAISYEETTVQAVDGRQQGSPHTTTSVFFVRRPDRTPPAQDIQLETPAEYAVGTLHFQSPLGGQPTFSNSETVG